MSGTVDLDTIAQLQDLLGDKFSGLVEIYLESGKKYIMAMKAGLVAGDAGAIMNAAHPFKSSSGNLGAAKLSALNAEIEAKARVIMRGEADDLHMLKPMIAQASDLFDESRDFYQSQIR